MYSDSMHNREVKPFTSSEQVSHAKEMCVVTWNVLREMEEVSSVFVMSPKSSEHESRRAISPCTPRSTEVLHLLPMLEFVAFSKSPALSPLPQPNKSIREPT